MTIFRRSSRSLNTETPILEASPSPSTYLLGDWENKNNVIVSSHSGNDVDLEDDSSISTNYSNGSSGLDESEAGLVQAFSDFSVKFDDKDENVLVEMDVPSSVPVDDLAVQVDDGILRVTGDISNNETDPIRTVEQVFQLDEQSLDVRKVTANLSNGVLTISAPKKDAEDATLVETLLISTQKPPQVDSETFQVIVDVPGVHLGDIHVSYANGKLRVAANRHFGRVRSFKRTVYLDTQKFDADLLQTYLYRGQLTVLVPPKKQSVLHNIEIQTSSEEPSKQAARED